MTAETLARTDPLRHAGRPASDDLPVRSSFAAYLAEWLCDAAIENQP